MDTPEVLYEDNHLIAIRKPAGMPSQGDISQDQSAYDWVMEYIRVKYQKPGNVFVGLLHRLDRPVAGVMVFAKTSKAASRLSDQFQTRAVRKCYHAVCLQAPVPPTGSLQHYIGPAPTDKNIVRAHARPGDGRKLAVLDYRLLRVRDGLALLEVYPETGRKHQIRVQLAAAGSPIVGDLKYGARDPLPDKSIALHAHSITFEHPVTKAPMTVTASLPGHWPWSLF